MATFRDLHPLEAFGVPPSERRLAVGWLQRDAEFPRGEVPIEFFERLRRIVAGRFEPFVLVGPHRCDLCQFDGPGGSGNVFVPDGERMFVSPELIVHYVATHHYLPPAVFQDAVMRCPEPGGREYRQAFPRAGGRALLRRSGP